MPCRRRSTPANWQTLRGAEDEDGKVDGGPDLATVCNGLGAKACRKNSETATTPEAALHASPATLWCSMTQHQPASCSSFYSFRRRHPAPACCGICRILEYFPPSHLPLNASSIPLSTSKVPYLPSHVKQSPDQRTLRPCSYCPTGFPKPQPALPSTDPVLVKPGNKSLPPTE